MADLAWVDLTFEKGLNTFDVASVLAPGECQQLDNMLWLPNGGLTPRPAWKPAGANPSHPAERRGRGIETSWYESGVRKMVVAVADATGATYTLVKTNVADPTTYGSVATIEAIAITAGFRSDPVRFAVGSGVIVSTHPGFPTQRLRKYDGTTAAAIATDNIAGRDIVYHLSRFWTGGNPTQPTHLRYSEVADEDAWDVENNFVLVGQDDGEPIEALGAWDRVLVVGKHHSLHYVAGDTPDNFQVRQLEGRFGAARGRSIVPTEGGVFVVGIDGNVYLWDGGEVRRITKRFRIDPAPAAGSGYVSAAFVAGTLYVVLSTDGRTVWAYEPAVDRWRREKVTSSTDCPRDLVGFDDRYLVATMATGSRLLSAREELGPFTAGAGWRDPQPDSGDDGTYVAVTGEVWPRGASGPAFIQEVELVYRQWTAGGTEPFVVIPIVDGVVLEELRQSIAPKEAAGVYAERLTFGAVPSHVSGRNAALRFAFSPAGAENETYSVESARAGWFVPPGRNR